MEIVKLQLAVGASTAHSPAGLMSAKKKKKKKKTRPILVLKMIFFFFFNFECSSVCRVRADGIFMYLKRVRCVYARVFV